MPNTTAYSFGDVVLVPFPFTDQTASKKRPAVVVSADAYHQRRPDVIVMAVTSQILRPAGALGEVLISDWQGAGLPKASLIKSVLATIEQRLILRKLGALPATMFRSFAQLCDKSSASERTSRQGASAIWCHAGAHRIANGIATLRVQRVSSRFSNRQVSSLETASENALGWLIGSLTDSPNLKQAVAFDPTEMASLIFTSWNQLCDWLKAVDGMRRAA
jgi:mRNA interferase MazF